MWVVLVSMCSMNSVVSRLKVSLISSDRVFSR